ncbi:MULTISPECIES: 4Fe-4S dicluster domain-containing protein [Sandaracinus]|uniref:4Fe-4S dicluster domain-containing protein n=1 Tax=Sandaracinus TaxID=1055688 RepID=UPI0019D4DFE3|nr:MULTISPECIES: 4Fe-4S dicluster domain-containing protein [Sandaracinus]QRN75825.1 ferredoxin/ferredoxin--NADP reductase [Sandaracinus sp.]UJR87356.1 Ferredoxin [Sandaracinus amylolyticus]
MAYVIAEPCVSVCNGACTKVCPVDAIHGPAPNEPKTRLQLYIDPEVCICCAACEPECPVSAIFEENALPPAWAHYRELNARFFRRE